jgi:alkylation response protein AidB-like acyl-CoA dehydrogenase
MPSVLGLAGPHPDHTDHDLLALRERCLASTGELRKAGEAIDRDPDAIADFLHLDAVNVLREPLTRLADGRDGLEQALAGSCVRRAVTGEAIAYGDPGFLYACPGPALAGVAVAALGDDAQCREYLDRFARWPAWSFFGLTEPLKGSAALELQTTLTPDPDGSGWVLDGEKRYIGNGARAEAGVVFCRRKPGPWGIEAVIVEAGDPGFSGELLPMMGLRGCRISQIRFDHVRIPQNRVLGWHLPPSRRGLFGATQTLQSYRPSLAAAALGVVAAVCDFVTDCEPHLAGSRREQLNDLVHRYRAGRRQVSEVAAAIDHGEPNAARIAAVKMRAAQLVQTATLTAADLLGPTALLDYPWLEKTYRDARGFEFMEGTSDIHRLAVFHGALRGTLFDGSPGTPHNPAAGPAGPPARPAAASRT